MVKLGFSAFLNEITIAVMAITGNYIFIRYLGTDGVAAFSIACYLFPIIFMVFNATVQSVQPIISFNYGCGQMVRSNKAFGLAVSVAVFIGLLMTTISLLFSKNIVSLFIPDTSNDAWRYAVEGLPLFALDYAFFGINIVVIGYYTGIEKIKRATLLTVLRGILPVSFFFILPRLFSVTGIWLAVGVADITTTIILLLLALKDKFCEDGSPYCPNQQLLQAHSR